MTDGALAGGNMNAVVRVGDTVRRTAGAWTPTIHRLLEHLRAGGFTAAPVPLGIDAGGREVLSFLPGLVPVYPLPDVVWRSELLDEAGGMLRAWHDASAGFPVAGAVWQSPVHLPVEVVCHNDFAPHNLVLGEDGALVGVIDVDMASPGPRVWDVAYLATRLVPLSSDHEPAWSTAPEARARLDRLLEAYGDGPDATDVLRVAAVRLLDLAAFSDAKAAELGKPELHEHAAFYRRESAWLRAASPELSRLRD